MRGTRRAESDGGNGHAGGPTIPFPAARMPPASPEAERGVIGGLAVGAVADPGAAAEALRRLRVDDFYSDDHRILFRAIRDIIRDGRTPDPITLGEELRRRGEFDRVGGDRVVFDCLEWAAHAANLSEHVEILRQKAIARDIISAAQEAMESAYACRVPSEEMLATVRGRLDTVAGGLGVPSDGFATMAEAAGVVSQTRWAWEGWIPLGVLSLLVAKGGTGKTRIALELARRYWIGDVMPDSSPNPFPPETPTLWIPVDRNFAGISEVASAFGLPLSAIHLPSRRSAPLALPELDDRRTLAGLRAQILEIKPACVFVDTLTYATARNTARAEEAKFAYDGLMDLAGETGAAIVGLTHMNLEGGTLNRRVEERARVAIHLAEPDPDGSPNRLRLWVEKSECKKPSPLGVTRHDTGHDFDHAPPEKAQPGRQHGPKPTRSGKFATWLWDQLKGGPVTVSRLVETARMDDLLATPTEQTPKPSVSPLYNARDRIPSMYPGHEVVEVELCEDGRIRKHWKLEQSSASESEVPHF